MKSYGSRLLTLLLAVLLVFTAVLPAFAIDIRYAPRPPKSEVAQKDVDEHPNPGIASKPKYFIFTISIGGFVVIPVFINSVQVSTKTSIRKPSTLSGANGYTE